MIELLEIAAMNKREPSTSSTFSVNATQTIPALWNSTLLKCSQKYGGNSAGENEQTRKLRIHYEWEQFPENFPESNAIDLNPGMFLHFSVILWCGFWMNSSSEQPYKFDLIFFQISSVISQQSAISHWSWKLDFTLDTTVTLWFITSTNAIENRQLLDP